MRSILRSLGQVLHSRTTGHPAPPQASGDRSGEHWRELLDLGQAAEEKGKPQQAVACYRAVLDLSPPYTDSHPWPEAHWRLGSTLVSLGRLEEALKVMESFVAINSSFADAYGLIGTIQTQLGRIGEAADAFERVLSLTNRRHALAAEYAAAANMALRRWDAANDYADLACKLNPSEQNLFRRAYLTLLAGNYDIGWKQFEEVLPLISDPNNPDGAQLLRNALGVDRYWKGNRLEGKTLIVWSEHGLGDSIMMARYLPLITERFGNCKLTVLTFPELVRLFSAINVGQVLPIPSSQAIKQIAFDYHCSIMSLPHAFGTNYTTDIPSSSPYLTVLAADLNNWADRLRPLPGLKVGLAWSGSPKNLGGRSRSIHLNALSPLFNVQGISWVNLQKGTAAEQLSTNLHPVANWMSDCHDLLDTAALISNLDLVISIDTSVAHLAGALGKSIWLLNRYESDWRWMIDRQDSPWYPTMRIFNQTSPSDWRSALAEMALALKARVG